MGSLDSYLTERQPRSTRFTDDFVIIKKLGEGGYGTVYKAKNKLDEKIYAIKVVSIPNSLDEAAKLKPLREIKALAELNHPNIVRYHHAWKENTTHPLRFTLSLSEGIDYLRRNAETSSTSADTSSTSTETSSSNALTSSKSTDSLSNKENSYVDEDEEWIQFHSSAESSPIKRKRKSSENQVVTSAKANKSSLRKKNQSRELRSVLFIQMELCSGMDLQQWIFSSRVIDRQVANDIIGSILRAVSYIHEHNYIHRDLKPSNIFITDDGVVKVGDFGLVKSSEHDADEVSNICSEEFEKHSTVANVFYMSPELYESKPYSYPVDIYAVGVIWIELLCNFRTRNEFIYELHRLRNGVFPIGFSAKFPMEYEMISFMVAEDPKERPEAAKAYKRLEDMYKNNQSTNEPSFTELVLQERLH